MRKDNKIEFIENEGSFFVNLICKLFLFDILGNLGESYFIFNFICRSIKLFEYCIFVL